MVASERDGIVNPIDLTFDDAGRLWTQTARMYPLDPVTDIQWNELIALMDDPDAQTNHPEFKRILDMYQGKIEGEDDILVLSNLYGNSPVNVTKWASGLAIPQSILPYKNGAYIAQGSELFFLEDENDDGRADGRIPLFTGFGITDTHTMAHTLIRGPGGWIYFSHGALNKGKVSAANSDVQLDIDYSKIVRFSLDGKEIELVSSGLNNIWGFQLRHNGQWYGTEANDLGYSVVPMEPGTGFPGIGNERLRPYQPRMPELHEFRVGGTGISGLEFPDDGPGVSFPENWNDVALLANPITSTINAVRIVRNADGAVSAQHLADFMTSEDEFFRPVNLEFGPDGCLYIADWYNKIISHNEVSLTHLDRDKAHGRIWRVCHESQEQPSIPNFYAVRTAALVDHLVAPSLWQKRAAWHQISDRPIAETKTLAPDLVALAGDDTRDEITRIHALWSLEGIDHYDEGLISSLLESDLDDLRREAVRSLASFTLEPAHVAGRLQGLEEDDNPMVRSQVLRTLADIEGATQGTVELLVRAGKPEMDGYALGGPYERSFERYLARKALEQYPDQLETYLDSDAAGRVPAENLLWASQALPDGPKEEAFLALWPKAGITRLDGPTFVSIARMLDHEEIYELVKPVLHTPAHASRYTHFALQYQGQVHSPDFTAMMHVPVNSLLQSDSEQDINLALDAIGKFGMEGFSEEIVSLLDRHTSEQTLTLALKALESNPVTAQDFFARIARDESIAFDIRVNALHSLARGNAAAALNVVRQWLPGLTDHRIKDMTDVLSTSDDGRKLLIRMYDENMIGLDAFDLAAAERLSGAGDGSLSSAILEGVQKREQQEKEIFESKLARFQRIVQSIRGAVENGEKLFQTCLTCHSVGDRGQNIAPALDGSAYRDTEALLTAILDPNAAVESGYLVYRIVQTDGGIVEGYLVERGEQGTTIAFVGGATVFIDQEQIRDQGFISGRSFMPEGLIEHYTDQEVADLISFIRTLE